MSTTFDFTKCKELQLSRKSFMPRASVALDDLIFSIAKSKRIFSNKEKKQESINKVLISHNDATYLNLDQIKYNNK